MGGMLPVIPWTVRIGGRAIAVEVNPRGKVKIGETVVGMSDDVLTRHRKIGTLRESWRAAMWDLFIRASAEERKRVFEEARKSQKERQYER